MYELLITAAADQDLDGIVEYIAVKLSNSSEEMRKVYVLRFFYGGQDYAKQL